MDRRIIDLYDEYTHAPLPRRVFLERLAGLVGSAAAASALLPFLENNYALANVVEPGDPRVATETVSYASPDGEIKAYLAMPKGGPAKRAGVIVVHENRGANPYIHDVTRQLAVAGYTALAPDLLSPFGGTTSNDDQNRERFSKIDRNAVARDVVPAVTWLKARPDSNGKVGTVGFCFGGGVVLRLATLAPDLDAAVAFYGPSPPIADVPKIRARLQRHYASNDNFVNPGVAAFDTALKDAGVVSEKYVYEGTEHAFHNYTAGARYNKAAADLAWERTLAFLKAQLAA